MKNKKQKSELMVRYWGVMGDNTPGRIDYIAERMIPFNQAYEFRFIPIPPFPNHRTRHTKNHECNNIKFIDH